MHTEETYTGTLRLGNKTRVTEQIMIFAGQFCVCFPLSSPNTYIVAKIIHLSHSSKTHGNSRSPLKDHPTKKNVVA